MKATWENQTLEKRSKESAARAMPDYERDRLGSSSAQLLCGEDSSRAERARAQKEQLSRWIQEQINEKAYNKELEREEEARYAEMLRIIGDMRDAAEQEDNDLRKYLRNKANRENDEVCV